MTWTDTHTAIAAFVSPAGLLGIAKGVVWLRERMAKGEAARVAEAVERAERYAAEKAHRDRVEQTLGAHSDRLDDMTAGLARVSNDVAHVRGRLDGHEAHVITLAGGLKAVAKK